MQYVYLLRLICLLLSYAAFLKLSPLTLTLLTPLCLQFTFGSEKEQYLFLPRTLCAHQPQLLNSGCRREAGTDSSSGAAMQQLRSLPGLLLNKLTVVAGEQQLRNKTAPAQPAVTPRWLGPTNGRPVTQILFSKARLARSAANLRPGARRDCAGKGQ